MSEEGNTTRRRANSVIEKYLKEKGYSVKDKLYGHELNKFVEDYLKEEGHSVGTSDTRHHAEKSEGGHVHNISWETRGGDGTQGLKCTWKMYYTSFLLDCKNDHGYTCLTVLAYGTEKNEDLMGYVFPIDIAAEIMRKREQAPLDESEECWISNEWLWNNGYRKYHFKNTEELIKKFDAGVTGTNGRLLAS